MKVASLLLGVGHSSGSGCTSCGGNVCMFFIW